MKTDTTRLCPSCSEHKSHDEFYHRQGKPAGWCKGCTKAASRASYQQLPKDHIKQRNEAWFDRQSDEYKEAFMAARAEKTAAARRADPERARATARRSADKRRASVLGTLKNRISAGMSGALTRAGAKRKARMHWEDIVGYTGEQLRAHLESKFLPGMSWERRSDWHIDHVRPLASFDFTGPDDPEFKRAWALDNLQPLWRLDNQRKHAKLDWQPGASYA